MNMRTQMRWIHQGRVKARQCGANDCHKSTREGKPYCPAHVELNPYVQTLLDRLAGREEEERQVSRQGARAVDVDGITAQEILVHLRVNGKRSLPRLCRELSLDAKTVRGYVRALELKKLVKVTTARRGVRHAEPLALQPALVAEPQLPSERQTRTA